MITHLCRTCASPVDVDLIDITTWADVVRHERKYLWGRWEECSSCGSREEPMRVVGDEHLTRKACA